MFTQNLNPPTLTSCRSLKNLLPPPENHNIKFDASDLQYQICSNFMRKTKETLYTREAQLLMCSQQFIQRLNQGNGLNKCCLKDISATQDTMQMSFQQIEDDSVLQNSRSMLILRKSKSSSNIRRTEGDYSWIIRQVKTKCTDKTFNTLSNLISQNKKLKEKLTSVEKKEREFRRKQGEYEKNQQQLFLLKKKAADNQKFIKSLQTQIFQLKSKIKDLQKDNKKFGLSQKESHSSSTSSKHIKVSLEFYLDRKQQIIKKSAFQLKTLYIEIIDKIGEPFEPNPQIIKKKERYSCQRCCIMFKKIKKSISAYRSVMEEEAQALQQLYEEVKSRFG